MTTGIRGSTHRTTFVASRIVQYLVIAFFLVVTVFPLVWVALSAFRTNQEILGTALGIPKSFNLTNFQKAFEGGHLLVAFRNSMIVTGLSIVLTSLLAFFVAYALNRFDFKLNYSVTLFISLGILIPINAAIMPVTLIMHRLHLNNSILGLTLLYTAFGLPISSLILKSYINSLPVELDQAAMADGATHYQILLRIIFPLCPAGFSIVAIQQFILSCNEFLFAMVLISSEGKRTLQLAISYFVGKFFSSYGAMFAAVFVAIMPGVIIFAMLQERVVKGLTAGALKG